ncbi:hypothetical protein Tco_0727437 [Tanacetum coccineum]|uniref:Uncharacterized protein n=1 Tax=Tanacetum coccineum TaxID=301880 RepID=A0ABQ4YJD2_9ASTR
MKEQAYNKDRDQDHKSLTTKEISFDLMKECHNELTLGEIVSLKIVKPTRILAGHRHQMVFCSHAVSNDLLPAKLKEVLYDNQFEQHWLQAENDRQVVGFGAEMVTDETYGFRGWNWWVWGLKSGCLGLSLQPVQRARNLPSPKRCLYSGPAWLSSHTGIDNEAASSMTHVAEDDETQSTEGLTILASAGVFGYRLGTAVAVAKHAGVRQRRK